MSIQDAMAFIQKAAEEQELQQKIQSLGDRNSLVDIIAFGREAGFNFSAEELRSAFAKDWAARYALYSHLKKG